MDFVSDCLTGSRRIRTLNIIDDFTTRRPLPRRMSRGARPERWMLARLLLDPPRYGVHAPGMPPPGCSMQRSLMQSPASTQGSPIAPVSHVPMRGLISTQNVESHAASLSHAEPMLPSPHAPVPSDEAPLQRPLLQSASSKQGCISSPG
jgi:hypothetical protein